MITTSRRHLLSGLLIYLAALGAVASPQAFKPVTAVACGPIAVTEPSKPSTYYGLTAPVLPHNPGLDINGYSVSGAGGKGRVTMTLAAAPVPPPGYAAFYGVEWQTDASHSYYAGVTATGLPAATGVDYSYTMGQIQVVGIGVVYSDNLQATVSGSVLAQILTVDFAYGSGASEGAPVTATNAETGLVGTFAFVTAPLPWMTPKVYQTTFSPTAYSPNGSLPMAMTGPGGSPFC
jgi:hypothetical protein